MTQGEGQEVALQEVAERYKAALPEGTFFHFPITAFDSAVEQTGVHSWASTFLPGPLGGGAGYGLNDTEAEVGSLGELHERVQSLWVVPKLETERGSYNDLVATYGADEVVNPVTLALDAGCGYSADMTRLWVSMKCYPKGNKWVLLEAVASSPAELPEGYDPLFLPVSNGLGAGLSVTRGLAHGTLELLQRDGNSVNYRALDQGRVLELSENIPDEVVKILERLKRTGLTINVKLAATDFGLVNLYVNGYGPEDDAPQIKLAACGEACDLDRAAALRKALLEFAFSRARLAFSHGPLANVAESSPEGYLDAHFAHARNVTEEQRTFETMKHWLTLSPTELKAELEPIYGERERIPFGALPERPHFANATPEARLQEVAERLEGFDILYLELATPRAREYGIRAVKVVIPSLEVETASYGRIGERNLRRLLARESPLVGLGTPPSRAKRIYLTDASEARFGDKAWFHTKKLQEVVGNLYPLYREPARHAVRYALGEKP